MKIEAVFLISINLVHYSGTLVYFIIYTIIASSLLCFVVTVIPRIMMQGKIGVIYCNTSSESAWNKDGDLLPNNTLWLPNRLLILGSELYNEGLYSCEGETEGQQWVEHFYLHVACKLFMIQMF